MISITLTQSNIVVVKLDITKERYRLPLKQLALVRVT